MDEFAVNPELYINFKGSDWAVLRSYLKARQESLMSSLCGTQSHDETNVTRGDLRAIRDLLSLEQAAANSRQQE